MVVVVVVLCVSELRLDEQAVKNNSKVMVLKVSEEDRRRQISEEQKKSY